MKVKSEEAAQNINLVIQTPSFYADESETINNKVVEPK